MIASAHGVRLHDPRSARGESPDGSDARVGAAAREATLARGCDDPAEAPRRQEDDREVHGGAVPRDARLPSLTFYLGTHKTGWLADPRFAEVPLFVSRRGLEIRKTQPRAVGPWALDSGGFTELTMHGRWVLSPARYVALVRQFRDEIGGMHWAAPQDWMCEPQITEKTGLTVGEHQQRTVENLLELRARAPELPIVPVLQGYTEADYLRCVELYDRAGVDLLAEPIVGLGTICRRQAMDEAEEIVRRLAGLGIRLHAFGAKTLGLRRFADALVSSDSLAWSFHARMRPPLPDCAHANCANCARYALKWREKLLSEISLTLAATSCSRDDYVTPFAPPPPPLPPPSPLQRAVLPRISPSQVDTFRDCPRKWGWRYLDGVEEPPHRSAACGQRVHTILEGWLRAGVPPDPNEVLVLDGHVYHPGLIAQAGIHNLPPPGPHHDIEVDFEVPFVSGFPALWRGRIDSAYEVLAHGTQPTPEVLDHKTTSNLGYRKLPTDLHTDAQGLVYAHAAMHTTGAPRANLRWVYYKSNKPYKSEVSFASLTREHVVEHLSLWEELAKVAITAKQRKLRAIDMQPNPRTCDKYGGCPHRQRCNLTPGEVMVATMSGEQNLMEKVAAARAQMANGGALVAPPPQNTAPVFAPAPPAPPPANGNGMLPAPWTVHRDDPNWLYNPSTGEFEQHTAEGVARIYARSQPAAPPPPPVVQAPPAPPPTPQEHAQGYMGPPVMAYREPAPPPAPPMTGAQAQAYTHPPAVAAPPPTPLDAGTRAAVAMAIQQFNALDSQILASYPHVAPHLAALRAELQPPQRATGINAPEGAALAPLAQPAAVVEAAKPSKVVKDESMVGDQYDAMDSDALRAFAKAQGIDTGGKREKNLRIAIRAAMQARASAPAAPPAPPAPPPAPPAPLAQQAMLAWPAQPPAPPPPSIPQAVQQHLAAPPPPPPSESQVNAAEIRRALDELNRVGDRLRKLIGAD